MIEDMGIVGKRRVFLIINSAALLKS